MDYPFALHLGGGLYMDSEGLLHQSKPEAEAVYEAPFKLPLDVGKTKAAFEGVAKSLKDIEKSDVSKKFVEWGMDLKLLAALSAAGKIAGIIAVPLAVASFVIDLLMVFKIFGEEKDPIEELIQQRANEIQAHLSAQDQQLHLSSISGYHNQAVTVLNFAQSIAETKAFASLQDARNKASALINLYAANSTAFKNLLDTRKWQVPFARGEHVKIWPFVEHVLFTVDDNGALQPAIRPGHGLVFDHRLMVPLASFAAESFLAFAATAQPSHRTTNTYRDTILGFAQDLTELASHLRRFGLARTVYRKEHFQRPLLSHEVIEGFGVSVRPGLFPVGAMDLRYHDDSFFAPFAAGMIFGPTPVKRGGMNLGWVPPALLQKSGGPAGSVTYSILNPEACAAAANAQAEQDYADLLMLSGYPELVRLATLMRHQATEPSRSETLRIEDPLLASKPHAAVDMTVKTEVGGAGEIVSDARREQRECHAMVEVSTQPLRRLEDICYRVRLRTLVSMGGLGWQEPDYASVQSAIYVDSLGPATNALDLVLEAGPGLVDQSEILIEDVNPGERVRAAGVARLKAHTFDWWIPIKPPFSLTIPLEKTRMELHGLGGDAIPDTLPKATVPRVRPSLLAGMTPDQSPPASGGAGKNRARLGSSASETLVSPLPELPPQVFWPDGAQDWEGQRRDIGEEEVEVAWSLDWYGNRLYLDVENKLGSRNYIVFVVVEEQLQRSGQWLHTAVAVPMNGQLTYVPQSFFDEERKAQEGVLEDLAQLHQQKPGLPGKPDPVDQLILPADLLTAQGLARIAALGEAREQVRAAEAGAIADEEM